MKLMLIICRAYATVKDFKGEWMADPRFQGSFYFVREEDKKEKKGKK